MGQLKGDVPALDGNARVRSMSSVLSVFHFSPAVPPSPNEADPTG